MLVLPRVYLVAGFTLAIALGGVLVSYGLEQGGPQTQPIPFHTITRGLGGGPSLSVGQASLLVNDNFTWANLWTKAFFPPELSGCSTPPYVNFTSETVLAVFSGVKPTGGYTFNITQVSLAGSEITVQATLSIPSKSSCYVNEELTNPFDIIAIPKTHAYEKLVTQDVVTNC